MFVRQIQSCLSLVLRVYEEYYFKLKSTYILDNLLIPEISYVWKITISQDGNYSLKN